jgi:TonB family protein
MIIQKKWGHLLQKNVFWLGLALLFHLFLWLTFSMSFRFPITQEKKPSLYISSYTYTETKPSVRNPLKQNEKSEKNGIEHFSKPTFSAPEQRVKKSNDTEDIHLIGDKKTDQPLIKLLGKALTAHLLYPKAALDFYLRGTVYVRFMIHPDGEITDIQLLQSSGTSILDNAALSGIRAMSPVSNVGRYLHDAKYLVVGVIF